MIFKAYLIPLCFSMVHLISSLIGHLGCFNIFTIINNTVMKFFYRALHEYLWLLLWNKFLTVKFQDQWYDHFKHPRKKGQIISKSFSIHIVISSAWYCKIFLSFFWFIFLSFTFKCDVCCLLMSILLIIYSFISYN